MNLPHTVINDSIVTQPPTSFSHQTPFSPHAQWGNNNAYNTYQLPLQLSQYYNVFPDVPSTKTSWTFPNGCVTSNIVKFTGSPIPSCPVSSIEFKPSGTIPIKRKSLTSDNELQPNKIFITEEKMAARMNGMHISNEFVAHNVNNFETPVIDADIDDVVLDGRPKTTTEPQLVVCDELKNLNKDISCMIPESLVPFEKTSTALVLWRPPMPYLNVVQVPPEEEYPHSSVIITDITDRPDLDNNNISTVDLNTLLNPPIIEEDSMEVMEI